MNDILGHFLVTFACLFFAATPMLLAWIGTSLARRQRQLADEFPLMKAYHDAQMERHQHWREKNGSALRSLCASVQEYERQELPIAADELAAKMRELKLWVWE